MMLYHTAICVRDVPRAAAFYDRVLGVLGYGRIWNLLPEAVAYGETRGEFWIQTPGHQQSPDISRRCHYAFAAKDEAAVHAFYAAALEAGGVGAAEPAAHEELSPGYFGAQVMDLDGNKIEVIIHPRPSSGERRD